MCLQNIFCLSNVAGRLRLRVWFVFLLLPIFSTIHAGEVALDKTESPYFSVENGDASVDALPLKSTQVEVRIVGVIADVMVRQHYRNQGEKPLEARYVFPGSTKAAVYGMQVRLGDRLLSAKIKAREEAREVYEAAKTEGKTAALLEQQRDNVFQMQVANIMPADEVVVELRYTELLVPTDGKYQFVFPTVVGPRYNGTVGSSSYKAEKWLASGYTKQGVLPKSDFKHSVNILSPTGVVSASSPSHRITASEKSEREIRIDMDNTTRNANNRDFVLDYSLSGPEIASGLILTRGETENFFLAMVEPPKRMSAEQIVPREYIFVIDVSGSMHGFPIETAKTLMNNLLGNLRPTDVFNVMTFSGGNALLFPQSMPATEANIKEASRDLEQYQGGGSTELLPALRRAMKLPADEHRSRTFLVITDGFVPVEQDAYTLIRNNLDKANLFALGIGSSVNRALIEGMARAGQGEPFVVLNSEEAEKTAKRLKTMVESPVLTHIRARFEELDVYDVLPQSVPDVFAERPVVFFGKWRGDAVGKLVIEGKTATGDYAVQLPVQTSSANEVLQYLWARHKIARLSDDEDLVADETSHQAIKALGLKYKLLTKYTSFVAVDEVVRNLKPDGLVSVDQPLPMPEGVSNLAVGEQSTGSSGYLSSFGIASTPEPEAWAMLMISLASMAYAGHRRRMRAVRKPLLALKKEIRDVIAGEASLPNAVNAASQSMRQVVEGVFDLPKKPEEKNKGAGQCLSSD